MRRVLAVLALASAGFVPPKLAQDPEIAGDYSARGTHPDGTAYEGRAIVRRVAGARYAITFLMPNGTFHALCLRDRDVLGCGWGAEERDLGVAIYRPRGGGLDGTWIRDGDAAPAREWLAAIGPTDDEAADLRGTDPTGVAYQGRFVALAVGPVRRLSWNRDGKSTWGWGIADADVLVAAFPSAQCGAALYRVSPDGRRLVATWMDFALPDLGTATEVLDR
jgi:hypothetical protein